MDSSSIDSSSLQTPPRIMVDMSATLLHPGHTRLLAKAAQWGQVIVGLATDEEILKHKGYLPELNYEQRAEVLLALKSVHEVVPTPWLIDDAILEQYKIDFLVHGDDNQNPVSPPKLKSLPRTPDISSTQLRASVFNNHLWKTNQRLLFTPGPSGILHEHLTGLTPLFGRNDPHYEVVTHHVRNTLLTLSGQEELVWLQGSASLALEIGLRNFVSGNVLLIDSGYYAQRLHQFCTQGCTNISSITTITPEEVAKHLGSFVGSYDWCLAVYTETSLGFKNDLKGIRKLCDSVHAKLFLDATASIGLEDHHELADVVGFSSCKGLFGITGAGFIAYKKSVVSQEHLEAIAPSLPWNYQLQTHLAPQMTGPYHALSVLNEVLPHLDELKEHVIEGKQRFLKRFESHLVYPPSQQPLLCTQTRVKLTCNSNQSELLDTLMCHHPAVLYHPRISTHHPIQGSVIPHLVSAFYKRNLRLLNTYTPFQKIIEHPESPYHLLIEAEK
ncbi:MAG: adenylyltransferase/cytidyltransferase family protein [Cyanobacteria bacterium]|nr:adenylyltransferase/cytidyltransferase family protein [Cyanobacteriota bacterium]